MSTATTTIDALLKDGRSALFDLEGASPGGGQVTSQPAYGPQVTPGDVVWYCGAWMAVTEAGHNGILGLTRLALIDAAGAVTRHTMLASDVIARRTDARIDPQTLYKLADQSAAYRYISTAPGATVGAVDDEQLAAWIEEKHGTSLDEGTIAGLNDVARLAYVAVQVLDEHSATHLIRDIGVWTLDGGSGEALITVDHPAGGRLASFTVRPQSLSGRTYREALAELLAIARALTGRLDALVASTAHLWTQATGDGPHQGDPADRTADAKRVLFDRILAAIPPGLRDRAEEWLTDLLYLAEDSLSPDGQQEVIRETLSEAGPGAPSAEIDRMPVRAAFPTPPDGDDSLEHWTVILRELSGPGAGTYRLCRVRQAGAPGEWEVFDGMPGAQGLIWTVAATWFARAVQVEAGGPDPF